MGAIALDENAFLQIRQLVKRFEEVVAVDAVSLAVNKGEIFALLGSSGCGKSTLLRMLAGFEKPSSGSVLLGGVDIATFPPYQRPINMMFQSYALFPHLTVWDNIAFGLKREGMAKVHLQSRVDEMLGLVQLRELAQRKPHQLSGGQQQRVALARSLAKKPQLLLLDEPLGALDRKLREQTQFELVNIIEKVGVTCVMVTHDQEEAMTMASRIAVMSHGQVVQVGTPKEIYESPSSRFVADFIGNINIFDGRVSTARDNQLEVQTEVGVMQAASTAPYQAGAAVAVAIRPEKINVSKTKPAATDNLFSGTVREIGYLGSYTSFIIEIATGKTLRVSTINHVHETGPTRADITWGDSVFVWWDSSASMVLTQ
jgi:putrescine transport system ATP-binding protein